MARTILKVENISKQYRLGLIGADTLSDDLKRWWYKIRGKQDPFLTIGDINERHVKGDSDYIWALRDINFDVQEGDVLGIIGKNGAGKSTLLKILSRVTSPTTGEIKTNGRIASLLEVGTGFHPELTGMENIFLNGAILGMTKKEIKSKIDEIVSFSGCERYIETPVKRYSSGMRVRLAFAVAAHLEPDILIVDEVLAVGDAEFQKKAIGKMQDISQGEGRTVLFVSHNMSSVESLCTRGIVLEHGKISYEGTAKGAVGHYITNRKMQTANYLAFENKGNEYAQINSIAVNPASDNIYSEDDLEIEIDFTLLQNTNRRIDISTAIYNESDQLITNIGTGYSKISPVDSNKREPQKIAIRILNPNLNEGVYSIMLRVVEDMASAPKLRLDDLILFHVKRKADDELYLNVKGFISPQIEVKKLK
ncbi:MAG: ATP-binding cassette domain-containing protein [Bacteroidia bacterium]|nr:ATP-binding cassette domain-containing protein [Bacteroidia bacterium]NND51914.1 ATP-binding cassette domain-containing protein [Flavobacteriaceae bacterium]